MTTKKVTKTVKNAMTRRQQRAKQDREMRTTARRRMAASDMQYLRSVPKTVPTGRVVVHNHVRPTMKLGSRGFRAWTQVLTPTVEVCRCGWAPSLGTHYRVKRQPPDA